MVPPDPVSGEGFLPASKMACLAISSHLGGVDTCPNSKKVVAPTNLLMFTRALISLLKAETSLLGDALGHRQTSQPSFLYINSSLTLEKSEKVSATPQKL